MNITAHHLIIPFLFRDNVFNWHLIIVSKDSQVMLHRGGHPFPIFFHYSHSRKMLKFAFSKSFTPFYCWGCFSISVISEYYIYTFLLFAHSKVSYLQEDAEGLWELLLALGKDLRTCRGLWNYPCSLTRHWTTWHTTHKSFRCFS